MLLLSVYHVVVAVVVAECVVVDTVCVVIFGCLLC